MRQQKQMIQWKAIPNLDVQTKSTNGTIIQKILKNKKKFTSIHYISFTIPHSIYYTSFSKLLQPNIEQPKSPNENNLLKKIKEEVKNTVLLADNMMKTLLMGEFNKFLKKKTTYLKLFPRAKVKLLNYHPTLILSNHH